MRQHEPLVSQRHQWRKFEPALSNAIFRWRIGAFATLHASPIIRGGKQTSFGSKEEALNRMDGCFRLL
jgi:hypothetical protein